MSSSLPFRVVAGVLLVCGCRPAPDYTTLAGSAEVRRDEWGVAHVSAHEANDALFLLGYETARDRLFQLDFLRRKALGRSAELFGAASLPDDRIARVVGFGALGAAAAADLIKNDPEVHRSLSAYALGISTFIADAAAGRNGATFPPEYQDLDPDYRPEPWTVSDTLALLKAELFVLAVHPESDLLWYAITAGSPEGLGIANDLYHPDPLEKVYITEGFPAGATAFVPPADTVPWKRSRPSAFLKLSGALAHFSGRNRVGPIGASNNWAICPRLTASGGTMLANDPHLGLDLPGNLYELHVDSDTLKVAGFGIPGLPALVSGHNDAVAWGVTTTEADDADTYLELVTGDSVTFNHKLVPMDVHLETIRSRRAGRPISEFDEESLTVRVVPHHGPVISDAVPDVKVLLGDRALSVKWPGFGITHESRAYFELMRAKNADAVKKALSHFEAGLLNFVYATVEGDIGYQPHAVYPLRATLDPRYPPYGVVPGTGQFEWTGQIPDDRIMQLENPPSCRIFSANNDPIGTSDDGDVLNDAFYLGGTFDYGLRARRIKDRLEALPTATLDDFDSVQSDVHSGLAEHFLPPLLAAARATTPSPAASSLLMALTTWDREETIEQIAPTIFNAWYSQLLTDVFADDVPLVYAQAAGDDRGFASLLERLLKGERAPSGHDYLGGETPAEVLLAALEKVARSLPLALGADSARWTWGSVHTNTFNHPLGGRYDLGPMPVAGGLSTVNASRYSPVVDGKPIIGGDVTEGPNVRMVTELTKKGVVMRAALPMGNSGVIGDKHYRDQLELWLAGKTRATHFERADVLAHAPVRVTFPSGFPGKGAPK